MMNRFVGNAKIFAVAMPFTLLNAFIGGTELGLGVLLTIGLLVAVKLQLHPELLERSRLGRWFLS